MKEYIYISMFIAALFTIPKKWKQPKYPPMDEWIKKISGTCIQWAIKRMKFLPFVTSQMDLEGVVLSEMSFREREI